MATNAFLISETYLKDNSPLSGNVDIAEIYPYTKTAEDIYIHEAIGTCLYDRLIAGVIANNLNANETVLVKKLRDVLVWYTCYDALPFIAIKVRNIGVVKQIGDKLESATTSDLSFLRKECKNKGDFYLKRVQDYLCCNGNLFPEYSCNCAKCDKLIPNTKSPGTSCDVAFD